MGTIAKRGEAIDEARDPEPFLMSAKPVLKDCANPTLHKDR